MNIKYAINGIIFSLSFVFFSDGWAQGEIEFGLNQNGMTLFVGKNSMRDFGLVTPINKLETMPKVVEELRSNYKNEFAEDLNTVHFLKVEIDSKEGGKGEAGNIVVIGGWKDLLDTMPALKADVGSSKNITAGYFSLNELIKYEPKDMSHLFMQSIKTTDGEMSPLCGITDARCIFDAQADLDRMAAQLQEDQVPGEDEAGMQCVVCCIYEAACCGSCSIY